MPTVPMKDKSIPTMGRSLGGRRYVLNVVIGILLFTDAFVSRLQLSGWVSVTSSDQVKCDNEDESQSSSAVVVVDRSWCPEAQCHNDTSSCSPCQRRFLMIITNGRSASTTLTWTLDLLPGLRMAGENNNVLQNIKTMFDSTFNGPMGYELRKEKHHSAFYHNPIQEESLACISQKMIETIIPPPIVTTVTTEPLVDSEDVILGFKTIRLFRDNKMSDVKNIVDFLKMHFPCTRYIVNHRSDVKGQALSQTSTLRKYKNENGDLDAAMTRIKKEVKRLLKFAELMGDRAKIIDSVDWTQNVAYLNDVVQWLGYDSSCAFPEVMELNTVNGFGGTNKKISLDPQCKYLGSQSRR